MDTDEGTDDDMPGPSTDGPKKPAFTEQRHVERILGVGLEEADWRMKERVRNTNCCVM